MFWQRAISRGVPPLFSQCCRRREVRQVAVDPGTPLYVERRRNSLEHYPKLQQKPEKMPITVKPTTVCMAVLPLIVVNE